MDRTEIFEKVKNILIEQFKQENITEDTKFSDLNIDSLAHVEFLIETDMEFRVEIKEVDIENLYILKDLVDYIKKKLDNNEVYQTIRGTK